MARQWRIEFPGALYHVLSRGNGGQDIFLSDRDRLQFLSLIEEMCRRFDVEVYAYVLMGNHYHLLLKTAGANLSRAMQWFGTSYTRKFNLHNQYSGHLFQGRFKSINVENDACLLRLSCYIHRNPLRAGLTERLADYPWSSYRFYAYRKQTPDWLITAPILNQLSGDDCHIAYRTMVQRYSDPEGGIWKEVKHGLIYGGQDFVSDLKARFLEGKKHDELPQYNSLFRDFNPDAMLNKAARILEFDLEAARNAKKVDAAQKDKRDLLVYLLRETGRLSNRQIGDYFGLTYSAVSRRVKVTFERMPSEPALKMQYQMLKSKLTD